MSPILAWLCCRPELTLLEGRNRECPRGHRMQPRHDPTAICLPGWIPLLLVMIIYIRERYLDREAEMSEHGTPAVSQDILGAAATVERFHMRGLKVLFCAAIFIAPFVLDADR